MRIEVEIARVYLVVEGKRERLTKAVAKQLPTLDGQARWRAAEKGLPQPEPICKVMGSVLGSIHRWLYLVQDKEAGLGWVGATEAGPSMPRRSFGAAGGWMCPPVSRRRFCDCVLSTHKQPMQVGCLRFGADDGSAPGFRQFAKSAIYRREISND